MRSLMLAAVTALAFVTAASAASTQGPYYMDSHGKCRGAGGQLAFSNLCAVPAHPYCNPAKSKACGRNCIPLAKKCHT